jgi:hypothetical protein
LELTELGFELTELEMLELKLLELELGELELLKLELVVEMEDAALLEVFSWHFFSRTISSVKLPVAASPLEVILSKYSLLSLGLRLAGRVYWPEY